MSEYDIGYFEGVRAVAMIYQKCLKRIQHDHNTIELQLDSEGFVTELSHELKEAKELRDRK